MNSRKPTPIIACTASTRARSAGGRLRPKAATAAPNSARMNTHRSIEPSWLLHTPRQLVEQRLHAVRIGRDVGEREVADHVGVHQREERGRDEQELGQRRRPRPADQGGVIARRADQRHDRLQDRDAQREDQREMADLGDHGAAPGGLLPV